LDSQLWDYCSSGVKIYCADKNHSIKVLDAVTLDEIASLDGHLDRVNAIVAHGNSLYSGGNDNSIRVWNLTTNSSEATLSYHVGNWLFGLAIFGGKLYSGMDMV